MTRTIGVAILGLVVLKWRGSLDFAMRVRHLVAAGAAVGVVSGLVGRP